MSGAVWASVDSPTGIASVMIDNPGRRNAMSLSMWDRLYEVISEIAQDPAVRVVRIGGVGGDFCAGADIGEFADERRGESAVHFDERIERALTAVTCCPMPVVAVLNGYCLGGGVSLAVAADIRLGYRDTVVGVPAARLGTVYPMGALDRLVYLVGASNASLLVMGAERIGIEDSLRMGLISRVCEDNAAADSFLRGVALNAPLTLAVTKRQIRALLSHSERLDAALERESASVFRSQDYDEGLAAFREHRVPRFLGR
ncbi:MAG: enoyl-CoA hydratase-related protein [Ferrimicrobium sp.]